jgi:hypothetical protein
MQLTVLSWNLQGLVSKLDDVNFLNLLNEYDILLLTKHGTPKQQNIKIDNYEYFSCPTS